VTKKALCLSEQAVEPHLKQLDCCAIAVAFLGTPHRGSGLTPFAKGVANILKAGRMRVNNTILQLLDRDSEVLADVEGSFGIWLQKNSNRFYVTCLFEELELPAVGMVGSPYCCCSEVPTEKLEFCSLIQGRNERIGKDRWIPSTINSCKSYGVCCNNPFIHSNSKCFQDMTKFSLSDDAGYRRILGEVKSGCIRLQDRQASVNIQYSRGWSCG
jgi:hypothetical protein